MKRLLSILFSVMLVASFSNQADAQSLMQTAKKAEQRAKELKQHERLRYDSILDSRDLMEYNRFIADYPHSSKTSEIRNRSAEIKLWNDAESHHTVLAYEDYLKKTNYHWYDNEAQNAIRSLKQIAEKQEWEKVVAINTIPAYELYLRENPSSGYRCEAENAINRIQGADAWRRIQNSNDIDVIQDFIASYPNASELPIAMERLHELKGLQYFNNGDLNSAHLEFSKISRDKVSNENLKAYDEVIEFNEFLKLDSSSTETSLIRFMKKYPNSKYYEQVSNLLAVVKARNLDYYASSYDYNEALSYAKDSYTKTSVQSYISMNKKRQRERRNAARCLERKRNGGIVSFGLDFFDMGYNWDMNSRDVVYYNLGLLLRVGNYRDRVQFVFGLKPGLVGYDGVYYNKSLWSDDVYESTEWETSFHMPFIAQLKLNLFSTSQSSRFFISGQYQYNAVRANNVESEMSWCVGLGFAWKSVDWSFYYRKDFGSHKSRDYDKQHYIGMSLIYYWQL